MLPAWLDPVQVETAPVPPDLEGATTRGVLWQAAPGRFLLDAPAEGRFLVEGGRRVVIDPLPAADPEALHHRLHQAPLAALLYQRGWLALHAAAAARDGGAVLLAGDSGAGKSTLLAALLQRGWQLIADDLAPLDLAPDGSLRVFPVLPGVALWPNSVARLGLPEQDGRSLHPFDLLDAPSGVPLRAIFWLAPASQDGLGLETLQGGQRFAAIGRLGYNTHIADALLDRGEFFRRALPLANAVPVHRLNRPRQVWLLDEMAAHVERLIQ